MRTEVRLIAVLSLFLILGCSKNNANEFKASGVIEAATVNISNKINGDAEQMLVREGDNVQAGDTLIIIDGEELRLQREQVRAQVDLADAQLRMALNGARAEDKRIAAKNAEAAQVSYEQAISDLKRIEDLFANGSGTQKQLDDMKSLCDIRKAQSEAAQQTLDKLLKGAREEEIDIARAQKAQTIANLNLIEKKIRDCYITSPITGTITEIFVEAGEMLTVGQDVLTLSNLQTVTLHVYIKEERLPGIKLGQSVSVVMDGSSKTFEGKVTYLSDIAEFTPKTIQTEDERVKLVFEVEITLQNPDKILKPGMPADAIFKL